MPVDLERDVQHGGGEMFGNVRSYFKPHQKLIGDTCGLESFDV